MIETIETIFAVLGLKLKVVIAAAIGAFISLKFFDNLKTYEKWTTFLGGWALASYLAVPLTSFLELVNVAAEQGIGLIVGLFGMSLTAAIIKVIRDTKWSEIIKGRFGGGQGGGP